MTPSWYDVLDVDEDATPAEIRSAWKAAIADLDPGERRFRLANQAAEVLLDPEKRAAHDEELAASADVVDVAEVAEVAEVADEPEAEPVEVVEVEDDDADDADDADEADEDDEDDGADEDEAVEDDGADDDESAAGSRRIGAPLIALGVAAVVLLLVAVVALVQGAGASSGEPETALPDERQVEAARGAAEAAVVPVLAYDYRTLAEDQAEARTYLTDDYAQEYDRFFAAAVETNAPRTETVVRVRVLESAIVRTGADRVDVLVFVNRPTTNKQRSVEYRDQVTMRMLDVDGTWLVDCLITSGTGPCDD